MEENDFDISVRKFNLYYNDFQALKNINIDIHENEVMFTELDHNGHLNNTHYSDIALNSLPEHHKNEFLSQMKIIFLSECKLNDIINTIFFKDSDIDVIRGEKNEHPVFIAMFKYGEKNGK